MQAYASEVCRKEYQALGLSLVRISMILLDLLQCPTTRWL